MLHPLLSLWRHSCRVTFYDRGVAGGAPDAGDFGLLPPLGTRRWFRNTDEAAAYLRYWAGDLSSQAELRWLLKKSMPVPAAGSTPERWLHALAGLLVKGDVSVIEETSRRARPARLAAAPSAAAAASTAALSTLPALDSVPSVPVPENLLPALEDVRIEGAEVLPELDQSLAQVSATMGTIDSASASVAPAPDKVPDISTAMADAAAKAQQAIDGG